MILALKIIVVFVLILPASILTALIWIFGGWTREYDMPNPAMALVGWIE